MNVKSLAALERDRAMIGQRFGDREAVGLVDTKNGRLIELRCKCGRIGQAHATHLQSGKSVSCRSCAIRKQQTTHGLSRTPMYKRHHAMVSRCHSEGNDAFEYYGARGIKVCDRWRFGDGIRSGFELWLLDMGEPPNPSMEIDRQDNDGNYEPDNCRWINRESQMQNTRTNHTLHVNDQVVRSLGEAQRNTGIHYVTILTRIKRGWSEHDAYNTPVQPRRKAA